MTDAETIDLSKLEYALLNTEPYRIEKLDQPVNSRDVLDLQKNLLFHHCILIKSARAYLAQQKAPEQDVKQSKQTVACKHTVSRMAKELDIPEWAVVNQAVAIFELIHTKNATFINHLDKTPIAEKAAPPSEVIRKDLIIAEAALCIFTNPYKAISDTIWLRENDNCHTLYEHLVGELDVELTGDYEEDVAALKRCVAALQQNRANQAGVKND